MTMHINAGVGRCCVEYIVIGKHIAEKMMWSVQSVGIREYYANDRIILGHKVI